MTHIDSWGRAYARYRDVVEPPQTTTEKVLAFQSDFRRITDAGGRLV